MSERVERFAQEVRGFAQWITTAEDTNAVAARNGVLRLTRLYLAGLELCACQEVDEVTDVDDARVDKSEWERVFRHAARLPINYYGVADPLVLTPERPMIGDLADDIADIYRDLVTGLRLYDTDRQAAALWYWKLMMPVHWGDHATSAIRALHCWLLENSPDSFYAAE